MNITCMFNYDFLKSYMSKYAFFVSCRYVMTGMFSGQKPLGEGARRASSLLVRSYCCDCDTPATATTKMTTTLATNTRAVAAVFFLEVVTSERLWLFGRSYRLEKWHENNDYNCSPSSSCGDESKEDDLHVTTAASELLHPESGCSGQSRIPCSNRTWEGSP